jgi:hypothetical protein
MTTADCTGRPLASFTATIRGCFATLRSVSVSIGYAGPVRDVVQDHGDLGRVRDGQEVSSERVLRRARVVRGHDEEPVGADPGRLLGQVDRVGRVERTDAGDDLRPVSDRLDHRLQQPQLLVVAGRGRLAGRPVDDESVVALLVDEVRGEVGRGDEVEGPVRRERRHHGRDEPAERWLRHLTTP